MSLLAVGLLAGRYCGDRPLRVLAAFVVALAAGLAIPPSMFSLSTIGLCLLSLASAAGALVALNASVPSAAVLVLAAIAGLFEGTASAPDPDHWNVVTASVTGGMLRAVLVLSVPLVVADWLVREREWHWAKIGLRVIAAWVVAVAILMQALILASS